jgi:hypothetical protein
MSEKKFWIKDPCILFSDPQIFPTNNMTKAEKLNALSRLAIIIAIGMYFMKYENWLVFLTLSLLIIILLYYSTSPKNDGSSKAQTISEEFTVTPTYIGTDLQQTIVAPTFAEEWQVPPPAYDLYTQVPYEGMNDFETPLQPQAYPYGQYISGPLNLLPSDEYYVHMGCGGARTSRAYVNSTFLRNDISNRENMTRLYKKKLARRFRQNNVMGDSFSPYSSY